MLPPLRLHSSTTNHLKSMDKWEDLWQVRSSSHLPFFSLYVSNLPSSLTARALKKIFEKCGEVISANVILDPMTGHSRGYGFVDYATDRAREMARSVLHNTGIDGHFIRVSRSHGKSTLYVGNLPSTASSADVVQSHLEKISNIPIKRIRKRSNYNYSFVEYSNHRQAQAALIALRNQSWSGCPLRVEVAAASNSAIIYDKSVPTTTTTTIINAPVVVSKHNKNNIHFRFTSESYHSNSKLSDMLQKMDERKMSRSKSPEYSCSRSRSGEHDSFHKSSSVRVSENRRDRDEKRRTLYVKNLDKSTRDIDFRSMFEAHGTLTRCLIIRDVPTRKLNYGFVQYATFTQANRAFHEVHGQRLNGVILHIEFCKTLPGQRKERMAADDNDTQHSFNEDMKHSSSRSRSRTRDKDIHWMRSHSGSRSVSQSYSTSRFSHSRSRSSSNHRKRYNPKENHSSCLRIRRRGRKRYVSHKSPLDNQRSSMSRSPSYNRSRSRSRRPNDKREYRTYTLSASHSRSSSVLSGTASLSQSSKAKDVNRSESKKSNLILHNGCTHHKSHKRHIKHYSNMGMTFPQLSLDVPLCVDLPKEFDMRYMRYLIAYDSREKRYVLFQANQTSSHLKKLQQTAIISTQAIISAQQSMNISSAMNVSPIYVSHQSRNQSKSSSYGKSASHSVLSEHESKRNQKMLMEKEKEKSKKDITNIMESEPAMDFAPISNEQKSESDGGNKEAVNL